MRDLIIIGGGPAGLAAAVYALGKQLDFLVVYERLGGKSGRLHDVTGDQPEYLAGTEAVQIFARIMVTQASRIMRDTVTRITKHNGSFQVETEHHGVQEALAVVVATGVVPLPLEVPGAKEFVGYGLGYSATTHAPALAGKTVAVVGTTARALRGVSEVSRTAKSVYVIAPHPTGLLSPLGITLQYRHNVETFEGYTVQEVRGEGSVEEVVIARDDEVLNLRVDALFVDLGLRPNSAMVRKVAQINLEGFIQVDDRNATTLPGLFAAGDVTTSFGEQTLIAIGDGARAALSAYDYILSRASARR